MMRHLFLNKDLLTSIKIQDTLSFRPYKWYEVPYPVENQFRLLHGDKLDMQVPSQTIRPPIEANTEYWYQPYIPYTLVKTNNKLVDVAGTYYINNDLAIIYIYYTHTHTHTKDNIQISYTHVHI
jgi:hypothetical protein